MSASADHEQLRQEEDKISSGSIIAIGATAIIIFAVGIAWAIYIQRDAAGTLRSYTPEQLPVGKQNEIGMVYQPSFDRGFADKLKAEQLHDLHSVGWIDESAKKVHIPIELAIKQYLAESEKNGGKL